MPSFLYMSSIISLFIPDRLERGLPNLSQGLLYQKLQMMNCCIEKKRSREEDQSATSYNSATEHVEDVADSTEPDAAGSEAGEVGSVSDDDEFFDAEDKKTDSGDSLEDANTDSSKEESAGDRLVSSLYVEGLDIQPQGRLSKLEDFRLKNVDVELYVPVCQEPSPMTEDLLAEHSDVLTKYVHSLSIHSLEPCVVTLYRRSNSAYVVTLYQNIV